MQTNLDTTEKAEVLADAIKVFRASARTQIDKMRFAQRLGNAGFHGRFIEETLGDLLCEQAL